MNHNHQMKKRKRKEVPPAVHKNYKSAFQTQVKAKKGVLLQHCQTGEEHFDVDAMTETIHFWYQWNWRENPWFNSITPILVESDCCRTVEMNPKTYFCRTIKMMSLKVLQNEKEMLECLLLWLALAIFYKLLLWIEKEDDESKLENNIP